MHGSEASAWKPTIVTNGKAPGAQPMNSATGLTTGFADLDRVTCGWQPGEEIVIAARPAVGKTAFALHLARTAASAGYHIAVYIFTYTIFFLMNN